MSIKKSLKKDNPDLSDDEIIKRAHKIYNSRQGKGNKEARYSHNSVIECKENSELNALIVKGYIATTHFDGQDIITPRTLYKWADEINEANPRANKVSINHNRTPHVAGVGLKGTARVDSFPDGHKGLFVETLIDKTREDYDDIKYRVDNNLLDSFSIEYIAADDPEMTDGGARILDDNTELHGWTLASQPMNENAVMIKEIMVEQEQTKKIIEKEEIKMTEQTVKVKEQPLSAEDQALLQEAKERKFRLEMKEQMMELMKDDSLKQEILGIQGKEKVLQNKEDEEPAGEEKPVEEKKPEENAEVKEFRDIINSKELYPEQKFARVGLLAEKVGLIQSNGIDQLSYKTSKSYEPAAGKAPGVEFKSFGTKGSKLEYKGLGITTNQNTDTDYLLSSAELKDMFDPVIYDTLNQSTTTWAMLRKDDFSNKGNNQVQFVLRTGLPNQTAGFYLGNSVTTSNSTLLKVQTKFKKAQVGVSVDGDMIAAARGGPIGDVFGKHVQFATEDLLTVINTALFAEAGAETAAACIGFEYITDSAGNTTLYNLTRAGDKSLSTYNGLAPDSAGDTYINGASARVSLDNLRKAIEQATKEGANINNLVFIAHPTQVRLFKGIYDAAQRLVPTSSRFGFEGRPEFDGVPIFDDKDANNDDWWLVDLDSHRIAIWVPPTLEMLGKRSDSEEGFVKIYFATYNWNPRRMVQIYGNATS